MPQSQIKNIIIISVSTIFGALLLLIGCAIVTVCMVLVVKRKRLHTMFVSHRVHISLTTVYYSEK